MISRCWRRSKKSDAHRRIAGRSLSNRPTDPIEGPGALTVIIRSAGARQQPRFPSFGRHCPGQRGILAGRLQAGFPPRPTAALGFPPERLARRKYRNFDAEFLREVRRSGIARGWFCLHWGSRPTHGQGSPPAQRHHGSPDGEGPGARQAPPATAGSGRSRSAPHLPPCRFPLPLPRLQLVSARDSGWGVGIAPGQPSGRQQQWLGCSQR